MTSAYLSVGLVRVDSSKAVTTRLSEPKKERINSSDMPTVGKKKFAYTPKGKEAAKKY